MNRDLSESVVRLHILANSDSAADQALKLAVRDRILSEASYIFENTQDPKAALSAADQNSQLIRGIAEDEIRRQGYSYTASVKVGQFAFPTKVYGDIMLPAGKYNAVRIEIGSGSGKNWWCVMYPPLCFTDGVVSVSDENRQKLKDSLTADEYSLITGKSDRAIPVEIRFKIVEIFQNLF